MRYKQKQKGIHHKSIHPSNRLLCLCGSGVSTFSETHTHTLDPTRRESRGVVALLSLLSFSLLIQCVLISPQDLHLEANRVFSYTLTCIPFYLFARAPNHVCIWGSCPLGLYPPLFACVRFFFSFLTITKLPPRHTLLLLTLILIHKFTHTHTHSYHQPLYHQDVRPSCCPVSVFVCVCVCVCVWFLRGGARGLLRDVCCCV